MVVVLAQLLASLGGVGFFPAMPGTLATLVAAVLAWFLPTAQPVAMGAWALGALGFGLIVAQLATRGHGDPSWVVIDELAGLWVALVGMPHHPFVFVMTIILFRFFDIKKPLGIALLQRMPGAWGVMFDDIAAGLMTGILMRVLLHIVPF